MLDYQTPLGAHPLPNGECEFCVWSPKAKQLELCLLYDDEKRYLPMEQREFAYYTLRVPNITPGNRYKYRIDGDQEYPDPASRSRPDGVHGASQIVDDAFEWNDSTWFNISLHDYVIYETHVGTFTPEGTFEAIIPHLDRLKELGITALELMPIAQFPGGRNWGYDGVYPYAAQNTYGGVQGLKKLVNACHQGGLAVILDVVYNHFGPEGNYSAQFAPYLTDRYKSSWGASLNFDGEYSDEVRRYFIENALMWLSEFHIDALRLDATHALLDFSAVPFLEALAASVHDWADRHNRRVYLIAENDRSDVKLLRSRDAGGTGIDAQWLDDFHHAIHVLLTGENKGYYEDYSTFEQLVKTVRDGFTFSGDYSPFRKRKHGTSSRGIAGHRFVVASQTHDQVGNRMLGERLSNLTDFSGAKLAAGAVLLSPYLPLLFMGEEHLDPAPFLFFISHGDEALVEAVRKGRVAEFSYFGWQADPPDPQSEDTFLHCKINHDLRHEGKHRIMYEFYKTLLSTRKTLPALRNLDKDALEVWGYDHERVMFIHRAYAGNEVFIAYNFNLDQQVTVKPPALQGCWRKQLDSEAAQWREDHADGTAAAPDVLDYAAPGGLTLPPKSFAVYVKE